MPYSLSNFAPPLRSLFVKFLRADDAFFSLSSFLFSFLLFSLAFFSASLSSLPVILFITSLPAPLYTSPIAFNTSGAFLNSWAYKAITTPFKRPIMNNKVPDEVKV